MTVAEIDTAHYNQVATARLAAIPGEARFVALHGNFHDAPALLDAAGIGRLDGALCVALYAIYTAFIIMRAL